MPPFHASRRALLGGAAALATAVLARPALSQGQWSPDRPIRFIVGFAPGGPTDVLARRAAQGFQEVLGQPVVVENRTGAAANIGSEFVVRAPADGYTLLVANSGQIVINPQTYERLSFNPMTDLAPISKLTTGPFLFTVNSQMGVTNHAELIALLKRRPGEYKYATTGLGGITHVVTEMWRARVGIESEPVHYRGTAAVVPELVANRIPMFFDGIQQLGQHVRAGTIRPMLRTDARRSTILPEVPSAHEVGVPDFNVQSWFALYAPRATPRPIIDRLSEVTRRVMLAPPMVERYAAEDVKTDPSSPEALAELGQEYFRLFGEAIRANNIRVES